MFVLTVQLNQPAREIFQRASRRERAVDKSTAPPLRRNLSTDEQLLSSAFENRLDGRRVLSGTDDALHGSLFPRNGHRGGGMISGVRDALQESFQKIVNAVRRALEVTPPELASDILDRGITLTGGGARLRRFDDLITFETGLPVNIDPEPLTCVVRGTGMILDDLVRWKSVLST